MGAAFCWHSAGVRLDSLAAPYPFYARLKTPTSNSEDGEQAERFEQQSCGSFLMCFMF